MMRILATLTLLATSILPSYAGSSCRATHVEETASSCMPGMVWDETTATCVEAPTS